MKFDFCIGNPPYQEEQDGENKTFAPPVYHRFMDAAYEIADKVELVHPARFLFRAGSTPADWNEKMLADPHLKVLEYEEDASKVFANAEIKAGIAVTYHDVSKNYGPLRVFVKYPELNSIMKKVSSGEEETSIMAIIFTQNRFNLAKVYELHPEIKQVIGSDGKDKRFRNNIFEKVKLFTQDRKSDKDIAVIGVIKNSRVWRYIDEIFVDREHENLSYWKVIVPRANGKGLLSDVLSSPMVIAPNEGYTQTFIGVGAFMKEEEANNALKYIKTKMARTMLCILKVDQHNERDTWRFVPIQDFTENSDIEWNKSISEIDQQLYKKYGLTQEEIDFIETNVKEME